MVVQKPRADQLSRKELMKIWWHTVAGRNGIAPYAGAVAELAEYFKLSPEEVHERCTNWEAASVQQWHSRDRSTLDSVVEFFQTQTSWIFDTMRYHAEQCQGKAFPGTVEVAYGLRHLLPGYHLDFGAGPGTSSIFFHKLGWDIALSDISTTFLDFARWRLQRRGIPAVFYNTHHERLPTEMFDLVTAFDVMVHIPNIVDTLAEIHRVLKPGGYFVFNIDSRPRGPTTEYHFFESHYPVLRHVRKTGFFRSPRIGLFYVWQKTNRSSFQTSLVAAYDSLRYSEMTLAIRNTLRQLRW